MRRIGTFALVLASLGASSALFAGVGCGPVGSDDEGSSEHANTASDLAEAREILALLNGPDGKCKSCHSAAPADIRKWGNAMNAVEDTCFKPEGLTPQQRIDCMRNDPGDPFSFFNAGKLGLYSAGTEEAAIVDLFKAAYGETWEQEHTTFHVQARMPRNNNPLTSAEFAKVKAWVLRGMPQLDQAASSGADAGTDAGVAACTPQLTDELKAHIARMKNEGWGARHADLGTPMFGCGESTNPLECLGDHPSLNEQIGTPGVAQNVRLLRDVPFRTHWWVRGSADGRFVGFGLNNAARVIDLSKPASAPWISVKANYDPWFLPSNDGFAFAGAHGDDAIHMCRQSLLDDVAESSSPTISLNESKCTKLVRDVYMSIGTSLDGSRYFMTWGAHTNDDGGHQATRALPANYGPNAKTNFVPMVNDGAAYRAERGTVVTLPYEGDLMLSPSTELAVTRYPGGYRVRFVKARVEGGATTVEAPFAGELCVPSGGKGSFSFDERFFVTHQYVDVRNPDHAGLPDRSSNIVIVDMLTGQTVRVTTMKAREFALFPHFRADGWLMFHVRDMNTRKEYFAASDVALRIAGAAR